MKDSDFVEKPRAAQASSMVHHALSSAGVQAVFYILFGQVQMAFTFFLSSLFSNSRTAVVAGYV